MPCPVAAPSRLRQDPQLERRTLAWPSDLVHTEPFDHRLCSSQVDNGSAPGSQFASQPFQPAPPLILAPHTTGPASTKFLKYHSQISTVYLNHLFLFKDFSMDDDRGCSRTPVLCRAEGQRDLLEKSPTLHALAGFLPPFQIPTPHTDLLFHQRPSFPEPSNVALE